MQRINLKSRLNIYSNILTYGKAIKKFESYEFIGVSTTHNVVHLKTLFQEQFLVERSGCDYKFYVPLP